MVRQNVAAMLQVVTTTFDLTTRIKFLGFDAAPVKVKTSLANMLLQSIIRSRRQMLKAKSEKSVLNSEASTPSRPSISAWVSRSNLSSYFAGAEDTSSKSSTVQIHYPMRRYGVMAPTDARSKSLTQREVAFPPGQLSRRKAYMKMRMVPQDKQTKANVVRCGYKPKVELKLSSTKKISEIAAHMSKKWAKVRWLLPKEAVLCFFEKKGKGKWSKEDSDVTCFDIWKRSGKRTNDENVVDVSYVWMVPETDVAGERDAHVQNLMPQAAPLKLVELAVCAGSNQTVSSSDESDTGHFCSTWALPEFGDEVQRIAAEGEEKVFTTKALTSDSCDEDGSEKFNRTTGRRRRRIKPVLVSKEEFNI
uniref:Uncharacterized protein n=1 Tax=Hyaloperonospora arabidopsidis (strain Emoy2) TaxID=559515 RepID=M4C6J7_HYAAE